MLVFSYGLMVALILNWNIQLTPVKIDLTNKQEIPQDIEEVTNDTINLTDGTSYEEMGAVYRVSQNGQALPDDGGEKITQALKHVINKRAQGITTNGGIVKDDKRTNYRFGI
jgi:hypothetical protein